MNYVWLKKDCKEKCFTGVQDSERSFNLKQIIKMTSYFV